MTATFNFPKDHLYFLVTSVAIFLTACNRNNSISEVNPGSVYKNWNLATIESIEQQFDLCIDEYDKAMYLNRLSGYKLLMENENKQIGGVNSRHTFLSEFLPESKGRGDFYVIETASESGSRVIIWNYILRKIKKGTYQVEKYDHNSGEWQKYPKTFQVALDIPGNLSEYFVKSGNGMNQDDVIISYVNVSGQVKSNFFLFNKLSKESGLEKIFELR